MFSSIIQPQLRGTCPSSRFGVGYGQQSCTTRGSWGGVCDGGLGNAYFGARERCAPRGGALLGNDYLGRLPRDDYYSGGVGSRGLNRAYGRGFEDGYGQGFDDGSGRGYAGGYGRGRGYESFGRGSRYENKDFYRVAGKIAEEAPGDWRGRHIAQVAEAALLTGSSSKNAARAVGDVAGSDLRGTNGQRYSASDEAALVASGILSGFTRNKKDHKRIADVARETRDHGPRGMGATETARLSAALIRNGTRGSEVDRELDRMTSRFAGYNSYAFTDMAAGRGRRGWY